MIKLNVVTLHLVTFEMFHIASTHAKMLPEANGLLEVLAMDPDTEKRCQSARSRVPMSPSETGSLEILEILISIHGYYPVTTDGRNNALALSLAKAMDPDLFSGESWPQSQKKKRKDPPCNSWVNRRTL